jgi:alkylation response protein AidB-like acyl-CoA dehydrogenase
MTSTVSEPGPAALDGDYADDDERAVGEKIDRLLSQFPPATTPEREFLGAQFDAGLAWVHFPEGYGGLGLPRRLQPVISRRLQKAGAPHGGARNAIGYGMAAPTILTMGSEDQRRRYLRPLFTCEEIWCQLFSEPGAGSDVASLATRAVRDGDEWVINGQKVWTTLAHTSKFGMVLARTNPDAEKHKGLTYFVVDMHAPGVEVRPLRQMTGGADFNEVFLTNVRVPRTNVIGRINEGWQVAVATLTNERGSLALATIVDYFNIFDDLVKMARELKRDGLPITHDPRMRQELAQFYIDLMTMKYTIYRYFTRWLKGATPGPEGSVNKLAWSELNKRMYDFAMAIQGHASQLMPGSPYAIADGRWTFGFLRSRANTIEAGTSEIHRNAIAERILGLPKGR